MTDTTSKDSQSAGRPKRKRGRQPVITFEVIDKVCQYLTMGHYMNTALSLCGIKERTWYKNMERAEMSKRPTKLQIHLMQSVAKADAQFEHVHVARLFKSDDPRISLEMLSRRHPDKWAATQKNQNRSVDKDGDDVKPTGVLVVPGIMDPDEWVKAAEQYKKFQPNYEEPADEDD